MALRTAGNQQVVIDLLEWQSPGDESAPYEHLYHLGIARIAFASDDLDGDIAPQRARRPVHFRAGISHAARAPVTSRFVCFYDPDGTVLELDENR